MEKDPIRADSDRDSDALCATLQALEVALHQPEVRGDRAQLDRLLHPRFREFARSGDTYDKASTLAEFADRPQPYQVWSQDFRVEVLAASVALLTYRSAHIGADGQLERHACRASLWCFEDARWQMIFHQGTPTAPFVKHSP